MNVRQQSGSWRCPSNDGFVGPKQKAQREVHIEVHLTRWRQKEHQYLSLDLSLALGKSALPGVTPQKERNPQMAPGRFRAARK
jgi:hypothetical protein